MTRTSAQASDDTASFHNIHLNPTTVKGAELNVPSEEIIPIEIITNIYQPFLDATAVDQHLQALLCEELIPQNILIFAQILHKLARPLTTKIQFNDWLFGSIRAILQPKGYVVESNKESGSNVDERLNEYWKSRPDCLVYHSETFSRDISSFTITVTNDVEENEVTDDEEKEDIVTTQNVYGKYIGKSWHGY